ncbi:iron-hydroxamate ABC transporter substrate-binding protein [Bacillus mesophilum]|uniref:Iron-hydroxamate ABC transporter substrate-binding protein n=1 Tax=Bacillus mesophilum TaxID=1071718 RepID=A0A7V7UUL5_9BACI|nr:iron-hydroxamate ABC transporter substrate-binding protein [Bacillus mesophilum]KAB2331815.1 iron-hydroxamate ABC transporter substrate-binding protein [Bacillus mesophilum]
MNSTKKKLYKLAAICTMALALAACGNDEQPAEDNASNDSASEETVEKDRVLTDALGNEVTIPAKPERVLASYLEDNLVALGITPVAQWSVRDGDPQEYLQKELESVPMIPHDLPFEAVASHNPDLIIMDSPGMVEGGKYDQYNKIAPTYVIGTEENNDWRQELLTIGEIFGREDDAQKVLDDYEGKAEEAKQQLTDAIGTQSAAAVWLVNNSFFIVSDNLSSGAVMYGDLGLTVPSVVEEISASATGNWSAISLEKLVELDADHLFLINSDTNIEDSAIKEELWQNIPAVKNGNVYEFGPDTAWLYTGAVANEQIVDHIMGSLVQ